MQVACVGDTRDVHKILYQNLNFFMQVFSILMVLRKHTLHEVSVISSDISFLPTFMQTDKLFRRDNPNTTPTRRQQSPLHMEIHVTLCKSWCPECLLLARYTFKSWCPECLRYLPDTHANLGVRNVSVIFPIHVLVLVSGMSVTCPIHLQVLVSRMSVTCPIHIQILVSGMSLLFSRYTCKSWCPECLGYLPDTGTSLTHLLTPWSRVLL